MPFFCDSCKRRFQNMTECSLHVESDRCNEDSRSKNPDSINDYLPPNYPERCRRCDEQLEHNIVLALHITSGNYTWLDPHWPIPSYAHWPIPSYAAAIASADGAAKLDKNQDFCIDNQHHLAIKIVDFKSRRLTRLYARQFGWKPSNMFMYECIYNKDSIIASKTI